MRSSFNDIINSERPILLDFHADCCVPCKMLDSILKKVKNELGNRIKIVKINVDKNQFIAEKHKVKGVPTMILFKKGEQLWRQSGALQKQEIIYS